MTRLFIFIKNIGIIKAVIKIKVRNWVIVAIDINKIHARHLDINLKKVIVLNIQRLSPNYTFKMSTFTFYTY